MIKKILKNLGIFILSLLPSILVAEWIGNLYSDFFHEYNSWTYLTPVIGLMLNYSFFIPFFFSLFGGPKNHYWIVGFLGPIILFEFFSSFTRFWLFALLILLGWLLGYGIRKIFIFFRSKRA